MAALPVLTTETKNQILVHTVSGQANHVEVIAAGNITPGMAILEGSAGTYTAAVAAGGVAALIIAKENPYIGGLVSTVYASGDRVMAHKAQPGDLLRVRLKTGETVAKGDPLIHDGSGSFKSTTGTPLSYPVQAEEAVTSASANPLVLVRVL